jgi:hypothetical protein
VATAGATGCNPLGNAVTEARGAGTAVALATGMKATSTESTRRMRRDSVTQAIGLAAVALAAASCTTDPYYYDPYAYYYGASYYYPTDIAYGGAYYADDMYAAYGTPVTYARARATEEGTPLPGSILRGLAAGENLCPGHVTVAKTPGNLPCQASEREPLPASTTVEFASCELSDGGRLDGSVQIDTSHTSSDTDCDADTRIDVTFAITATNLAYTAQSGARVVLPTLTQSGAYTRGLKARPAVIEIGVEGQIERYDKDGEPIARTTVSGKQTLTPLDATGGYRVSGSVTMNDTVEDESVRATSDGVSRPDGCCHPTSGSIELERSNGDLDVLRFGPDCGDVTLNSESITLRDCL